MDARTDIEREAAEAVSILYLETLQRAKSAEEAAEEARRQRDDQHRERMRTQRQLDEARTHQGRIERERIKGVQERDRKIARLETEREAFREAAQSAVEAEAELRARGQSVEDFWGRRQTEWEKRAQELRNSLTLAGVEKRSLETEKHELKDALIEVRRRADNALGS